jgi:uncharacterized membrane protein
MLASLLTLPDPPTQPAFKPPYQPLQLYAGAAIAGAFVYVRDGRSAAKAEPDSAAATTIPSRSRFIAILEFVRRASGSSKRHQSHKRDSMRAEL